MSLTVEVLPRLGCANIVITGPAFTDLESEEVLVKVDNCLGVLVVQGLPFPLPPSLTLLPHSASGLTLGPKGLAVRIKLAGDNQVGSAGLLASPSMPLGRHLPPPSLNVEQGKTYSLRCRCSQELSSRFTVSRLLPLPSTGWQSGALEWYCCVSKLHSAPPLDSQAGDLLYSPHSLLLHSSHLNLLSSCPSSSTSWTLVCPGCKADLGSEEQETDKSPATCLLWGHAITFSQEGQELVAPIKGVETAGGQELVAPIKGVETAGDTFVTMVNQFLGESLGLMPKVVVKNRLGDSYLLWAMDKELTLLKGTQGKLALKSTVIKMLIKQQSDAADDSLTVLTVSDDVLKAGLELLEESTRDFPDSVKLANSFRVGYLPSLARVS